MLGRKKWLSLLITASLATVGFGVSAAADAGTESQFLSKINASRSANGMGPLTVDSGLRAHARTHTQDMISAGEIYHSTSAELAAAAGSGWSKLGENVGRGSTVSSLHEAFMNSSGHRKNILGDYNYVGIGTGTSDGRLYVTVVFMKKGGSSATTTTSPPPTTTAPPPPATTEPPASTTSAPPTTTSTTTTLPPTTTTTLMVGPDKHVTPGLSCVEATRFGQICHD